MKLFKGISILIVLTLVCSIVAFAQPEEDAQQSIIRIHIRANDDSAQEQAIKLKVRDAVNEYLAPILNECINIDEAEQVLNECISDIERIGSQVSGESVRASLRNEEFPERTYGEKVYPAGMYKALIVEIGKGEGANWWCVAFPPMCYTSAKNTAQTTTAQTQKTKVKYRSFLGDWFNSILNKGAKK